MNRSYLEQSLCKSISVIGERRKKCCWILIRSCVANKPPCSVTCIIIYNVLFDNNKKIFIGWWLLKILAVAFLQTAFLIKQVKSMYAKDTGIPGMISLVGFLFFHSGMNNNIGFRESYYTQAGKSAEKSRNLHQKVPNQSEFQGMTLFSPMLVNCPRLYLWNLLYMTVVFSGEKYWPCRYEIPT